MRTTTTTGLAVAALIGAVGTATATENLVGFNYATASSTLPDPQNWNRLSSPAGVLSGAIDDTGAATGISIEYGGVQAGHNFVGVFGTVSPDIVPQHDYDLTGMAGHASGFGDDYFAVISGLEPDTTYEYWFVAYAPNGRISNLVKVSDGDTLDAISFNQSSPMTPGGAFVVNSLISSSQLEWNGLSNQTLSSSDGEITFNFGATSGLVSVGAIAVRKVLPVEPFDIRMSGEAFPASVDVGQQSFVTFTVSNPGDAGVTGIVASIELPAGLQYVSNDRGGTLNGSILTADLGDLPPAGTTIITVTVLPDTPGEFVMVGDASANEPDPTPGNNAFGVPLLVGETDLSVTLASDINPVAIDGDGVTFTVTYENLGPRDAQDTQIVFTAPPELSITGASAGVMSGSTVTLDIGQLASGDTGSFTISADAIGESIGAPVAAEISHPGPDPDDGNDTAEKAMRIVQTSAGLPRIDTIFSNHPGLANSQAPGSNGAAFGSNNNSAFDRPFQSPDGRNWIFLSRLDDGRDAVLVGSGDLGSVRIARSDPEPFSGGGSTLGSIYNHLSINDSGSWVAAAQNSAPGSDRKSYILKYDAASGLYSTPIRSDDTIPGSADITYGSIIRSPAITNAGAVGTMALSIDGDGFDPQTRRIVVLDGQIIARSGITPVAGAGAHPDAVWSTFTNDSAEFNADGSSWVLRGTLATPDGSTAAGALNNSAYAVAGQPVPGAAALSGDVQSIQHHTINSAGDWMARGATAAGERFALHNGQVVAWLDGPTGLDDGSVWNNDGFTNLFFGLAANNNGGFAVGGQIVAPGGDPGHAYIYYCQNGNAFELLREGDPVDLSGNGLYDNDAFLHRWQNDRVFLNGSHLYFVAQVRDTYLNSGSPFAQGFFRVELPDCGPPACPPDLNGDGVVDADDFFLFLSLFAQGDPRADFNNDGVIDADDFFAYLSAFATGCP